MKWLYALQAYSIKAKQVFTFLAYAVKTEQLYDSKAFSSVGSHYFFDNTSRDAIDTRLAQVKA